jgi:hypothetical protein
MRVTESRSGLIEYYPMRVTLTATYGSRVGPQLEVGLDQAGSVGRDPQRAELAIPQDEYLSSLHFYVECNKVGCRIRNVGRNGTLVNGSPVEESALGDDALIQAGHSFFSVRVNEGPLPGIIEGQALPVYAILDAARSPDVVSVLASSGLTYLSLYEGAKGAVLANVAPYLVALSSAPEFLERLLEISWGKSWGVYLTSRIAMPDLRDHLRRFLLVKDELGRPLSFRFYDPRVLRVFLPVCMPAEVGDFFGPIRAVLLEDEDPLTLLRFTSTGEGTIVRDAVRLT